MIPDRAPEHKRHCLTMYAYQQAPMVPPKPSNAEQRKIVAECSELLDNARRSMEECSKLPKPNRSITAMKKHFAQKIRQEVGTLFSGGPLTVNMIQQALGLSVRESAGRKVRDWYARGLIVEDTSHGQTYKGGRVQKWWRLASNACLTGAEPKAERPS